MERAYESNIKYFFSSLCSPSLSGSPGLMQDNSKSVASAVTPTGVLCVCARPSEAGSVRHLDVDW